MRTGDAVRQRRARQQVGKVYRVGYINQAPATAPPPAFDAFRRGLRDLGWVEGENLVIDARFVQEADRLSDQVIE